MDTEKLIAICWDKYNKYLDRSWEDIAMEFGFQNGETLRGWFKRYRKALKVKLEPKIDTCDVDEIVESIQVEEDRKGLSIVEFDEMYEISSPSRFYTISKEKLRALKLLYCDSDPSSINGICRSLDIARRDFFMVKNAFNITHDDVPFIDEDMQGDLDNLVVESLERKKEKFFVKLQNTEYDFLKSEIKKYRSKDYLYGKIVDALSGIKFECNNYSNRQYSASTREGLLNLADVHLGIVTDNYWNQYDVEIATDRFEELTQRVIEVGIENNISTLHVSNLGDVVAGQIHQSIVKESEIDIVEQVKLATELIGKMLIEFSMVFDKIVFADVAGNHGRIVPEIDKCTENENFEYFISWGLRLMLSQYKNIVFESNVVDKSIIVKNIAGVLIYQVHGNYDTFQKIASDLTMMIKKPDQIMCAHFHHYEAKETHSVDVYMSRSFCGVEAYSKGKRLTSKSGQSMYIYENGKMKYIADILF